MKRWVHFQKVTASKYLELPEYTSRNYGLQPAYRAKSAQEIDRVLFDNSYTGEGGGLCQMNIRDAINNSLTSTLTLDKLADYIGFDNGRGLLRRGYITHPNVSYSTLSRIVEREFPSIKFHVDNGGPDYLVYSALDSILEVLDNLTVSDQLKAEIKYYAENYKEIIADAQAKEQSSFRNHRKSILQNLSTRSIIDYLNNNGIDTTKQSYKLVAEEYQRGEAGDVYTVEFNCAGDWLAYLSMLIHQAPTTSILSEYFSTEEFMQLVDECPDVDSMEAYATAEWWGDGDDFIIYLKNNSQAKYLYKTDEASDYE